MEIEYIRGLYHDKYPFRLKLKTPFKTDRYLRRYLRELSKNKLDVDTVLKLCSSPSTYKNDRIFLELIENTKYKKRFEQKYVALYCEDRADYDRISQLCSKLIIGKSEPYADEEISTLKNEPTIQFVARLPKGKYQYRLRFSNAGISKLELKNIAEVVELYKDFVEPNDTFKNWLQGKSRFWQNKDLNVLNDKIATLICLSLSNHISKSFKFVIRNKKVNTEESNDEVTNVIEE